MTDSATARPVAATEPDFDITLFVAGDESNSRTARANLNGLCEKELRNRCRVTIVDVLEDFSVAAEHGILVTPTLLVNRAGTEVRFIGNLHDREKVCRSLGLENNSGQPDAPNRKLPALPQDFPEGAR